MWIIKERKTKGRRREGDKEVVKNRKRQGEIGINREGNKNLRGPTEGKRKTGKDRKK